MGEPRAQDESRLDGVAPARLSDAGRPSQPPSRADHATQSLKPTIGLQFSRSPSVGSLARRNPNSVLRGKTDDEGAEAARSLRGRPCACAGRVRVGRRQRRRRCGHDDQRDDHRGRRLQPLLSRAKLETPGAVSSVGRAPARQAGGHWFEPSTAHLTKAPLRRGFFVPGSDVRAACGYENAVCGYSGFNIGAETCSGWSSGHSLRSRNGGRRTTSARP